MTIATVRSLENYPIDNRISAAAAQGRCLAVAIYFDDIVKTT